MCLAQTVKITVKLFFFLKTNICQSLPKLTNIPDFNLLLQMRCQTGHTDKHHRKKKSESMDGTGSVYNGNVSCTTGLNSSVCIPPATSPLSK